MSTREETLKDAYRLGFEASGEGWNGEWPFEGINPETDSHWVSKRDQLLAPLSPEPAPAKQPAAVTWQDMASAPKDGKHCILAIKMGAFVYSIEGAFMQGKWMNAADIDGDPLAWLPKVRIPEEFLPWTEQYKARAALSHPEPTKEG